jgi:hypothetical protein
LVDEAYVRTEMPLRDRAIVDAKLALDAATPTPLIDLRPKAIELYREAIEMLRTSISRQGISDDLPPEVFRTVREALGRIVVKPTPAGEPVEVEIYGQLSALVDGDATAISMVAEEGLGRHPHPDPEFIFKIRA